MIDIEKSEKLPAARRYFNVSVLWIFYYRSALRLLYSLRIPHEAVTLLSIGFGLASAFLFYEGKLIAAAITLHLKDLFDACDGALARLTGRGHLIGRYLDSLGDFLVLTAVVAAIVLRVLQSGANVWIVWGILAVLSIFIQCSFFNFYQLAYLEQFGIDRLTSKRDEASRTDLNLAGYPYLKKATLSLLRFLYSIVYGWQDRFVAAVDNHFRKRCANRTVDAWYGDRLFLTLQSPLCFGTHIFVFILSALFGRPEYALVVISVTMNLYLLLVLYFGRSLFPRSIISTSRDEGVRYRSKI